MGVTHGIGVPPPNKTAERWPVTSPLRCFYLSWNFAIRRSSQLFCAGRTWGRRDVACNVSLSIMVFLPPDHVIVGMEYGDMET